MESNASSGIAQIGRLFWMMLGPAVLFLLAISIARDGGGWFTLKDFAFLTVLGGLLPARIVEFGGGDPRTATGKPATRQELRRYFVTVLFTGIVAWTVANLIGNHPT